jgi:hypothetical protein
MTSLMGCNDCTHYVITHRANSALAVVDFKTQ